MTDLHALSTPAIPIKDAAFPAPFPSGLEYASPARGPWNIVHVGMLLPESHQIFVCAQGCLRGVVLTAAELHAERRFSTIAIEEHNLLDGDMEQLILDGVSHILEKLSPKPRAVLLFTSCVHHFVGCDLDYVYRKLREKFPEVDFTDCYMNPIMRKSKMSPDAKMRMQLYSLIKPGRPAKKQSEQSYNTENKITAFDHSPKKQVNVIGETQPPALTGELFQVIRQAGYEIRDICGCKTYEAYQELGEGALNLTFLPSAVPAGEELARRLGIPHLHLPASFRFSTIEDNASRLAAALGQPAPGLSPLRESAEAALRETAKLLDGMPVAIDYTAVPRPLELAELLLDYGFHVESVYADSFGEGEREAFTALQARYGELKLYPTVAPKMGMLPRSRAGESGGKLLAIGQKAAYFTGTRRFVNILEGGGLTGYDGICRLMAMIREDAFREQDVPKIIQVKGWGCCG